MNLKIISAGAGSGKTFRLTRELTELLTSGLRPEGIFATTFTKKAAAELQERVRISLLKEGYIDQANALSNALIGTVHSLGTKLLQRFSFEAGVSPQVSIIAEEDGQHIFNQSIAMVLNPEVTDRMEDLCNRLGLHKRERHDWRREVRLIADTARANNFSTDDLKASRDRSWESFAEHLPEVDQKSGTEWTRGLLGMLEQTIQALKENADKTKKTEMAVSALEVLLGRLNRGQHLHWHEWAKIAKIGVGAKSRDDVADLLAFAMSVEAHRDFQDDIKSFIHQVFDLAVAALTEYERYKHERGLIDYTDMEALVNNLLDHPQVQEALSSEIDLLMVDEFQDTSPIQLSIFWKLSRLVGSAIWVGDPKQSIYGFRGADPSIMRGIIEQTGGISPENIQGFSWRSREDLVLSANAIFTKAFSDLPPDQVALEPKRVLANEDPKMTTALMHWHFTTEEQKTTNKEWMGHCIARNLAKLLDSGLHVVDKNSGKTRPVKPGDIAVLCRTNKDCQALAEAAYQAGLNASVARNGLTETPEVRLVIACLKYVLNDRDSLSVAEILRLSGASTLQGIIDDRIAFLAQDNPDPSHRTAWGSQEPLIRTLKALRPQVGDLSSAEILDLVIDELHLRHVVSGWGRFTQRQDNIDALRRLASKYEDACNRLQSGASLGGFLLWLEDMNRQKKDRQGAGEGPEAIRILTYHRSKGLEWPVVVCHDLENQLRDSVYGLQLVEQTPGMVDLDNILGNRWIRYWVSPYQDQEKGMPLTDNLSGENGPVEQVRHSALREEARLLYVGLTRARDYLVLVSRERRPLKWLNRCCNNGAENMPTLIPNSPESPWCWNDRQIPIDSRTMVMPDLFEPNPAPQTATPFFSKPPGRVEHRPLDRDVARTILNATDHLSSSVVVQFHDPLKSDDNQQVRQAGLAMQAMVRADHSDYSDEKRVEIADGLLNRFEVDQFTAETFCAYSKAFHQHLNTTIQHESEERLIPVRVFIDRQRFEATADRILDTGTVVVLVRDVAVAEKSERPAKLAASEFSWAAHAFEALKALYPDKETRILLHFVPLGSIVEIQKGTN